MGSKLGDLARVALKTTVCQKTTMVTTSASPLMVAPAVGSEPIHPMKTRCLKKKHHGHDKGHKGHHAVAKKAMSFGPSLGHGEKKKTLSIRNTLKSLGNDMDSLQEGARSIAAALLGAGLSMAPMDLDAAQGRENPVLASDSSFSVYVVKKGDNLSTIAKKIGVKLSDLIKWNTHIKDKNKLRVGDKIYYRSSVPVYVSDDIDFSKNLKDNDKEEVKYVRQKKQPWQEEYEIEKGDNLTKIANKLGVNLEQIKKENFWAEALAEKLQPGWVIVYTPPSGIKVDVPDNAANIIAMWEDAKFRGKKFFNPYFDKVGGVPTIGFGTTFYPDGTRVRLTDKPISANKALEYLNHSLEAGLDKINRSLKEEIPDNWVTVLLSFGHNAGQGALEKICVNYIANKDYDGAIAEMGKYTKAGKDPNALVNRRKKERTLWETGEFIP